MLIAINARPKKVWGGGSHFIRALHESLVSEGHEVRYDLKKRADAILIVYRSSKSSFSYSSVSRFIHKHKKTVVCQRINNLDTHDNKGSLKQYKKWSKICHGAIYVSEWAQRFAHKKGLHLPREYIIPNIVHSDHSKPSTIWDGSLPFRIVTHHWSTNSMKGFETYRNLGRILASEKSLRGKFEYTYIGRLPSNKKLKGVNCKPPLHGHRLADKIKANHVYLTASRMECGPYHVLEAIASGLPVLYGPDGGAIKEYVGDCGFSFDSNKIIKFIKRMRESYGSYYENVIKRHNNYSINTLGKRYVQVFKNLRNES